MVGFIRIHPTIKKIDWKESKQFSLYLEDGRIITVPSKQLPSTKMVKPEDRNKYQILSGNMFTWNSSPEVYHIEQILGTEIDYSYKK